MESILNDISYQSTHQRYKKIKIKAHYLGSF